MYKLIPRITGGIGNQLFTYAAARRLALVNSLDLVIDHVSGFQFDIVYKRDYQLDHFNIPCRKASAIERMEPFSRIRRYIMVKWSQCLPFEKRGYIKQESNNFDKRLISYLAHSDTYIEGYWQSEKYFKDVEIIIRKDLKITPPRDSINLAIATHIKLLNSISVHVRFFDDPQKCDNNNNVPQDYYIRAINAMECFQPGAHYFIFSDKPDLARTLIPLPDDRVTVVKHNKGQHNAYADLWLMTKCKHFIIANSTFSWWGAWLSDNKSKQVIAPGYTSQSKKSGWGFDGLLPEEWIKL